MSSSTRDETEGISWLLSLVKTDWNWSANNSALPLRSLISCPLLFRGGYSNAILIFMPPTSKKLEGHIASGMFVRPSVRPLHFLMHSITSEPCMLGF